MIINDGWEYISLFIFLLWALTIEILFEKNKEINKLKKKGHDKSSV